MKKLLFMTLFTFGLFITKAQENIKIHVDVKMSEIFKDKKSKAQLAFSTKDNDGGMFVGKRYNKGYLIEHYSKDLKLIEEFDFVLEKKRSYINDAFMSGDQLCLIERSVAKKTKDVVYTAFLSPKTNIKFSAKKLFSLSKKEIRTGYFFNTIDNDALGDYQLSENHKYIAFTFDINDKKVEKHKIIVFNNALEKVYETLFSRDIKDRRFQLQNIDIDEKDGTLYLLGKVYPKGKRKKKGGKKYQYELTKIKGDQRETLVFDTKENHVNGLKTLINNGKLSCVGFYSEKKKNRYKGIAHFKVENMKITNTVYSPFTQQFLIDKYGKKKQKELRNITIRKIFITKNNDIIINAEEYYSVTTYNAQTGMSNTTYYFMDMIGIKMDENGKLIWARNINKKQISRASSPPYLSYISTYVNGVNYFLINGSKTVKKMSNNRVRFKSSNTNLHNLFVIQIDQKGNTGYHMLLDKKETKMGFAVNRAVTFNNGKSVLFQGKKGSKKRILRLDF